MFLTKFDPFSEFRDMQRFFDRFPTVKGEESSIGSFSPQVNTREGEFAYHIDVDLPGMKKDEINISVDNNRLTISGERNFKDEVQREDYYKIETSFGKFQRVFTLPDNADVENIDASTQDGVLEIVVPKLKEEIENKKKIEIK
ncbi:MAG: Hsp20/alpha crystallin family protein [Campylobacterota bacterium]|nr:Hsp20/alpha crystallin family protein [Campylobacterota bacterium]